MLVGGGDESSGVLALDAARAAADDAGLVLEVVEGGLPGGGVCLVDGAAGVLVAECVEQTDALGNREDEVEACDRAQRLFLESPVARGRIDPLDRDSPRPRAALGAELFAGVRVFGPDQRSELPLLDDAFELQGQGATARPDSG